MYMAQSPHTGCCLVIANRFAGNQVPVRRPFCVSLLNKICGQQSSNGRLVTKTLHLDHVHAQGKVLQALRCAQRYQLKSVAPDTFLSKAAETGVQGPEMWCM